MNIIFIIIIIIFILLILLMALNLRPKQIRPHYIFGGNKNHLNKKQLRPQNTKQLRSQNTKQLRPQNKTIKSSLYEKIHNILLKPNSLKQENISEINKNNISEIKKNNISENKHWTQYDSWEKLKKDNIAMAVYMEDKSMVVTNPNLDWSLVLQEMLPKLTELREYIGIINLSKDKKTLKIKKYEASNITAGEIESDTVFASIPGDLVEKYANIPALFMFHTHPSDPRGCPLPSSHDLSTALYFASISKFAASIIISSYGVLMYGLTDNGYQSIIKSRDWNLAVLNLSYDIISAHESIRSWNKWKLSDYIAFYDKYRMFLYVFPSSKFIGDYEKNIIQWSLESPVSYDLITEHYEDILEYLKNKKHYKKKSIFAPIDKIIFDIGLD